MSQHPEDTATNRFRTWWAGIFAALSFGLVTWLVVAVAGGRVDSDRPLVSTVDRADARLDNLSVVKTEQVAAISTAAVVDDAANTVKLPVDTAIKILPSRLVTKSEKTEIPVPGAMIAPAAEAEGEEAAASDEKSGE